MSSHSVNEPPAGWGTYADAERLRRWSFEQRTPGQRLQWLVDMLAIAYQSGAIQMRAPAAGSSGNTSQS
jgi:hypothetical protein